MKRRLPSCGELWSVYTVAILFFVWFSSAVCGQAPANFSGIAGRTFKIIVTSGNGPAFTGTAGSTLNFLPSANNSYDIVPTNAGGVIPSTGNIVSYTPSGPTAALRVYDQVLLGYATITCNFATGTYTNVADGGGGTQAGTFTMSAVDSPDSIAGAIVTVSITRGDGVFFAASGSYRFLPVQAGTYTIQPISGTTQSSGGSYIYTRNPPFTGGVVFSNDPVIGAGSTSKLFFDSPTTGTVTLIRQGGWTSGFQTGTFTINTLPTISPIGPLSTLPETPTPVVPFTVRDMQTAANLLSVSKASSNTTLVPVNNIILGTSGGSGENRTVRVTPAAGQTGSSAITLTVSDGTLTATTSFTVTVDAPPTIPTIPNAVTDEDIPAVISFTVNDAVTPAGSLQITGSSSDTILVPNANLAFGGTGSSRTLTVTPAANRSGSTTITVTVTDGGGLTASRAFLLTVTALNDPPVISSIDDQTTGIGMSAGPIFFTVDDVESGAAVLTVTASSTNPGLVPVSAIVPGGSGNARSVLITPVAGVSGFSDITLTVNDGQAAASETFRLSVNASAGIPKNSEWKYLAPLTAGAVPANWNTIAFSDASWSSGRAPMGFSPGGEDGETTAIPTAAGKPLTVYFRKKVYISDPQSTPWLQLNLRRDDGAVVYLNGNELCRSNMAESGAVSYATPARISLFGPGEFTPVSRVVPATGLVAGDNVFAVEVHQITAASSDMGFDLEVIPLSYAPPVIAPGDDWKYLAPASAAGAPPADWKTLNFSDAGWSSGIGVFGYGGDDEVTVLPVASGSPFTAYFRKKVIVSGVSQTKGIRIRLRRDDGAVIYLNGIEKWRSNMPEGVNIAYSTPARSVTGGVNETTWFTREVTAAGLVEGENVIAVEVHQESATSSDLSFDMELTPLTYVPNPPPWISDINDRALLPGAGTGTVAFTVGDGDSPATALIVSATSSNPAVIPAASLVLGGGGSSRTVNVTAPSAGQPGSSLITVTVSDGFMRAVTAFVVTVAPSASSIRLVSWGDNDRGQLGNNSNVDSDNPIAVTFSAALAAKTPIQLAAGEAHGVVLFSDGTLAAWGRNDEGQLGTGNFSSSPVPVPVPMAGALAGKIVTAIDAGRYHTIALCSDGTVACWGGGGYGELGNNGSLKSPTPVQVFNSGVLAGKTVTRVAAGSNHNLALCSDGTVAAWGMNYDGALGISVIDCCRNAPVAVERTGALLNKTVIAISAGYHSLALCSDGTLAAWGDNQYGQLGNNNTSDSPFPVEVNRSGVLSTRTPTAIAAGSYHSLAACSDGRVAAWGYNNSRQLGDGTNVNRYTAVLTANSGALSGKTVHLVAAGLYNSAGVCTDGTAAEWGDSSSSPPAAINVSAVLPGRTVFDLAAGSFFKVALTEPAPPPFKVTTMSHIAAGDVFLGFPALEGVSYHIEWSDTLGSWARWGTVSGPGGELITRLPGFGAAPRRYFRAVQVE